MRPPPNDFELGFRAALDEVLPNHDRANGAGDKSSGGAEKAEAAQKTKQRFELTRFNAVLLSSSGAYLVKGLIPRGGLTVVWGPPKCGKSFWTFDVAMHVARGEPYRGRRVQPGVVVYLALEGGNGFRNRIEAYRRQHDVADAPFYLATERTDLVKDHEALIAAIRVQIPADVPGLVVLDTLNRSLAGSESKDEDMAAYIRSADAIREAFDCAVVIVHHCGVDGSRPRGHTSLTGAADAQHAVSRDAADNIVVTVEWMKTAPRATLS
jgi:RecA-family ATPase